MEDKRYTVMYLEEALKADCECVSAFNKLLTNYLMGRDDLNKLIEEMKFTNETVWLKDYYLSRVNLEVRAVAEQEGVVRIKVGDGTNSSHLYVASENDDSGLTPRRF